MNPLSRPAQQVMAACGAQRVTEAWTALDGETYSGFANDAWTDAKAFLSRSEVTSGTPAHDLPGATQKTGTCAGIRRLSRFSGAMGESFCFSRPTASRQRSGERRG